MSKKANYKAKQEKLKNSREKDKKLESIRDIDRKAESNQITEIRQLSRTERKAKDKAKIKALLSLRDKELAKKVAEENCCPNKPKDLCTERKETITCSISPSDFIQLEGRLKRETRQLEIFSKCVDLIGKVIRGKTTCGNTIAMKCIGVDNRPPKHKEGVYLVLSVDVLATYYIDAENGTYECVSNPT